ncbi:hypothetical protein HAX54_035799 [Datura stramonium]|uniref:F-box domain-containing protein n=1 Tax=Datura stramonium TaxID=4076 RepID=A0ABS8RMR7_DATST|nr:hypothetical protein [Datura stramonium]
MAIECFTWFKQLLLCSRHRDGDDEANLFTRLPDCLLIDILSRLPADCLFRCRRDCRVWNTLISSPYFSTLHLKRDRPVVIIQCQRCFTNLFVFRLKNNKEMMMFTELLLESELMINKVGKHDPHLRYSCDGVLLFSGSSRSYQYPIYTIRTQMWKKIHCPTPNLTPYVSPAIVNGAVHLLLGKDLEKPDTPPCAKGIMVLNMFMERT